LGEGPGVRAGVSEYDGKDVKENGAIIFFPAKFHPDNSD